MLWNRKKKLPILGSTVEESIAASIFDEHWYRDKYKAFVGQNTNAFDHFLNRGMKKGFDPSPLFDSLYYAKSIKEEPSASTPPFLHFIRIGVVKGANPHPLFDLNWYLKNNNDVAQAGINPLEHYIRFGAMEGRNPHPMFDSAWYVSTAPLAASNPLKHYWTRGRFAELDPHPLFMSAFYRTQIDDGGDEVDNLLLHYLDKGSKLGLFPNPLFDPKWYLETYSEVSLSGLEPLTHFIIQGASEGKNPSTLFETSKYLSRNPDVRSAGHNPLSHFLRYGAAEGRENSIAGDEDRLTINEDRSAARTETTPITVSDKKRVEYIYPEWLKFHERGEGVFSLQRRQQKLFDYRPKISIIVPVYKVNVIYIAALVQSVKVQTYDNWELCLTLAYHDDPALTNYLEEEAYSDPRIKLKVLSANGGISRNSNAALSLATGEYIALLDHDDIISGDALFETASALNNNPRIDFLYSDKDTMSESGDSRFNPLFKPQWSPELMLSVNYLTHFNIMRAARIKEIGGWDPATDGAQDWDIFLRFITKDTAVHAIRRPLYHWRVLPTSVASGLAAKPWAAVAQLRAISAYLQGGWPGAMASFFVENVIHIKWSKAYRPSAFFAVCGNAESEGGSGWESVRTLILENSEHFEASYFNACSSDFIIKLNSRFEESKADCLVLIDASSILSDNWLCELLGPLQNDEIAVVGGRLENASGQLIEGGLIFEGEGAPAWLFAGETVDHWGIIGGARGYRNFTAVTGSLAAIRRSAWSEVQGFTSNPLGGRFDVDFFLRISARKCGRIMHNSYALSTLPSAEPIFVQASKLCESYTPYNSFVAERGADAFFHPALTIVAKGKPSLRPPLSNKKPDFVEEARYFASILDVPSVAFSAVKPESSSSPLIRSLAWFLPDFDIAFYGGIMTILRASNYLQTKHAIEQTFVVFTNKNPEKVRAVIARAFPDFARTLKIVTSTSFDIIPDLVSTDAAICTLWVTAFAMRRLESVKHRFYFVQDYEPLFYPAGSTSAMAEMTYRFGFHGICNTFPLRQRYIGHGGIADYFLPSIDTSVFHDNGRIPRKAGEPFLLFNYARPGHPRNCFEIIAEGLMEAKRRLRTRLCILTAGADWNPSDYKLNDVVEHMGLLTYEDTGKLYRSVDAGLVAMTTPHPSYLPFELMACKAVTLTNRNRETSWLLEDKYNCLLFELTKSSIADTIEAALDDEVSLEIIRDNASMRIAKNHSDWDKSCESIAAAILGAEGTK